MNRMQRAVTAVLLAGLAFCAGCDGTDEPDGADGAARSSCLEPTPVNPLLGCPELGDPTPTACDSQGATWEEVHSDIKTFWQTQPSCTPLPEELVCRSKSVDYGDDWPDLMEAGIQAAAEQSGGFQEEQVQALRCLGAMEPSDMLSVGPGDADARVPSSLSLRLEVPAAEAGVSIHDDFLLKFGAMVGTILHVTDDYEFEQERKSPGDGVELRLKLVAYKGIPVDPDVKIRIDVELERVVWPGPEGTGEVCPGRWIFASLRSDLSRHVETFETVPDKLVSKNEAVAAALAECGEACSHPVTVWDEVESGPALYITMEHLIWRVMVDCPAGEAGGTLWMCTYKVDAESGEVLSGGPECCID